MFIYQIVCGLTQAKELKSTGDEKLIKTFKCYRSEVRFFSFEKSLRNIEDANFVIIKPQFQY